METATAAASTNCRGTISLIDGYPANIGDYTDANDLPSAATVGANSRVVKVSPPLTGGATTHER